MALKTIPTTTLAEPELAPDLSANIVSRDELKALRKDQSFMQRWDSSTKAGEIAAGLEHSVRTIQAVEKARAYEVVMHDTTNLLLGKHKQLIGKQYAAIEQDNRVSADLALQRAGNFTVQARSQLEHSRAQDFQRVDRQAAAGEIRAEQVSQVQDYTNSAYDYVARLQQDGFVGSAQKIKEFYDGATPTHGSPMGKV